MGLLGEARRAAWRPPDMRRIWDWGRENIILNMGGYAIPGNFHVEKSRHIIEPLATQEDGTNRVCVVLKATQTFGSGIADVKVPWTLSNSPGPTLWCFQTDQIAAQHAETRAMPVIRSCPPLRSLLPEDRHKQRNKEIIFRNGVPLYIQGPAIAGLQSKSIRYFIGDEIWLWKPGMLAEALMRLDAYRRAGNDKTLLISQGGVKGDDLDQAWESGTMEEWEVACLECGKYVLRELNVNLQVKRADGSLAGFKWDDHGSSIRYECEHCGQAMIDTPRLKALWNATGKYHQTNPNPQKGVRSFHWNTFIAAAWEEKIQKYRRAMIAKKNGVIIPFREIVQKDLARPWDEQISVEKIEIVTHGYSTKPGDWSEDEFRFMTIDRQKDHRWVCVRSWSKTGKSRLLWYGRLFTKEECRAKQIEFGVPDTNVGQDARFESSKVYRECAIYDWTAFKGEDKKDFFHKEDKQSRVYAPIQMMNPALGLKSAELMELLKDLSPTLMARYERGELFTRLFLLAKPSLQEVIDNLYRGNGAEFLVYDGVPPEYGKQMNSAFKRTRHNKITGKEEEYWYETRDDHARDCEIMQLGFAAMAEVLNVAENQLAA